MAQPGHEERAALVELAARVRAQLEVEAELGGRGVPAWLGAGPGVVEAAPSEPAQGVPVVERAAAVAVEVPAGDKLLRLEQLAAEARECRACRLHERRTQAVFSRGSDAAELVFVGEGPGQEEDRRGLPFVGPAGQLLDRMIDAMGYGRDEVYVCNVVKCRPPDNRTPKPDEAIACSKFLVPQIEIVAPKLIVALGRCAAEHLGVAQATGSWRGRWGVFRGVPVMPTYHPAFLLRSPEFKRVVWEDLQQVLARLGRSPKARPRG